MKALKTLSAFLLTLMLCAGMLAIPVSAASTSQDGLEISLTTDKDAYQQGETIAATLTVTNTNPFAVQNVSLETLIPDGYQLADGSTAATQLASLGAGETATLTASFAKDTAGSDDSSDPSDPSGSGDNPSSGESSDPQIPPSSGGDDTSGGNQSPSGGSNSEDSATTPGTGDNRNVALWIGLFVVAGCVLAALGVFKKKRGVKVLSLFLCVAIVGNLIPLQAFATGTRNTARVSTAVTVDGASLAIEGIVSYDYEPLPEGPCTVTFESNGGSAVASVEVEAGETLSAPEAPIKEGFVFIGWYTTPELDEMFLFDDDVIVKDITLYAGWEEANPDLLLAQNAALQLNIGYQQGDNANHVTRDVTLPTTVEEVPSAAIAWTSDSSAVSSTGAVTRPQGADASVTLTATATVGEESYEVAFALNVVAQNDRDPSEIPNYSVIDLENMNQDGEFDISYNDDKTQVISIEGKFSDFPVENADDALDAIQGIHTILGIQDPYEELDTLVINEDEYGAEYTFAQSYEGTEIYSRRITVSADENGVTDSLSSGVLSSGDLQQADNTPVLSAGEAEAAALAACDGGNAINSTKTVLSYYALDEYETDPVLTYKVTVSGDVDETVFVNAVDGSIVETISNIEAASAKTGSGKNELGEKVSFPVAFTWTDWYFYYMQDLGRDIQMYKDGWFGDSRIGSEFNSWGDETAVSAYTHMITTFDWYKNELGRDSVDNNGMKLKVIVHNSEMKDNAFWSGSNNTLNFCDNSNGKTPTTANALDVIAHEYTHGVVQFATGGLPYQNATGAINEGYADIFGCLVEGDWEIGENWKTLRDAANPTAYGDPDKRSSPFYIDYTTDSTDNGGVHTNSSLVYHAAYLMTTYGMDRDTLAKVWYKSLSMGFDGTSNFSTVRTNVIKAARKLDLSQESIGIIQRAFDEVEIYGPGGTLEVTVTDLDMNPIDSAIITIQSGDMIYTDTTSAAGEYTTVLGEGTYTVNVDKEGYVPYTSRQTIEEAMVTDARVFLVHPGQGRLEGQVVSATTADPIPGATVSVRRGINVYDGEVLQTVTAGEDGRYAIDIEAGYYTLEISANGYTTGCFNAIVDGGHTSTVNGSLSPVMTSGGYRVVLTWGENPRDLDSHLRGTAGDGSGFHIYYSNKQDYREDGSEIGNLDVDDTTSYGPETTTFTVDTTGSYYFYVYKYSGSGSLASSEAKVEVYNGERLIGRYTVNPGADTSLRYWNVFKIENGIYTTVDTYTKTADVG